LVTGAQVIPTTVVPGQNASYTFAGVQNQHVSLSISNSTFVDCTIWITNPDGTSLLLFGTSCSSTASFFDVPLLPQSGTYKLLIDPSGNQTGTLTLKLNDASDVTGSITADGTPLTVATSAPGQKAKLTFAGTAGQMVTALLDNNTYTQFGVDLEILNPAGSSLGTAGGFGSGTEFLDDALNCSNGNGNYLCGNKTLLANGTYTLLLAPGQGGTGQARVRLFTVNDLSPTGVLGGAQIPVTTSTPGQNAKITFTGTQGGRLGIGYAGASFSGIVNPVGLEIHVTQPDGTLLSGPFNFFGVFSAAGFIEDSDSITFPTTGTYTVVLNPSADTVGSMNVNLYDATDLNLGISADGSAHPITTSSPGQNAHLNFTATAGQRVSALVTNIAYADQPDLNLWRVGSGSLSGSIADGSNRFLDAVTITQAGNYFLLADPLGQEIGSETVTLYTVNDISATVDTLNHPTTVTTTVPGQNANITFSATSGQTLNWSVSGSSFAGGACFLTLKNPDNSVLAGSFDCTGTGPWSNSRTAPQTGTYTIAIDPVRSATGSLTVSVLAQ
jgi:hypothetical protein